MGGAVQNCRSSASMTPATPPGALSYIMLCHTSYVTARVQGLQACLTKRQQALAIRPLTAALDATGSVTEVRGIWLGSGWRISILNSSIYPIVLLNRLLYEYHVYDLDMYVMSCRSGNDNYHSMCLRKPI